MMTPPLAGLGGWQWGGTLLPLLPLSLDLPACGSSRVSRAATAQEPSTNYYHFNDNRILPPNVDAELATAEGAQSPLAAASRARSLRCLTGDMPAARAPDACNHHRSFVNRMVVQAGVYL